MHLVSFGHAGAYPRFFEQEIHKKKFVCEVCGLELSSRQQLIAHTYRHTGDLPYKCDVQGGNSIDILYLWSLFESFLDNFWADFDHFLSWHFIHNICDDFSSSTSRAGSQIYQY